jgi:hypothetical protein
MLTESLALDREPSSQEKGLMRFIVAEHETLIFL